MTLRLRSIWNSLYFCKGDLRCFCIPSCTFTLTRHLNTYHIFPSLSLYMDFVYFLIYSLGEKFWGTMTCWKFKSLTWYFLVQTVKNALFSAVNTGPNNANVKHLRGKHLPKPLYPNTHGLLEIVTSMFLSPCDCSSLLPLTLLLYAPCFFLLLHSFFLMSTSCFLLSCPIFFFFTFSNVHVLFLLYGFHYMILPLTLS